MYTVFILIYFLQILESVVAVVLHSSKILQNIQGLPKTMNSM